MTISPMQLMTLVISSEENIMWSLETMDYLNREAARKARRGKREPQVVSLEEIDNFPPFPFPHLGPYVPAGWERVEDATWFADSSG